MVYELTPTGQALAPAMMELARWGARFMEPPEPGDQIEARWARSALVLFKRWDPTPEVALEIEVASATETVTVAVQGGADGTSVENRAAPEADAHLRMEPGVLIGALLAHFPVADALADGRIEITGDASAASALPELFDLDRRRLGLLSDDDAPSPPSP